MSLFADVLLRNKYDNEQRIAAITAAKDDIERVELIANWINGNGYCSPRTPAFHMMARRWPRGTASQLQHRPGASPIYCS